MFAALLAAMLLALVSVSPAAAAGLRIVIVIKERVRNCREHVERFALVGVQPHTRTRELYDVAKKRSVPDGVCSRR